MWLEIGSAWTDSDCVMVLGCLVGRLVGYFTVEIAVDNCWCAVVTLKYGCAIALD